MLSPRFSFLSYIFYRCEVGQERINCAVGALGSCSSWPKPIITSVTGPGTKGGITNGGEQIIITGKNFVGPRGSDFKLGSQTTVEVLYPTTADILVRYGGPSIADGGDGSTPMYYLNNCVLSLPCQIQDDVSISSEGACIA